MPPSMGSQRVGHDLVTERPPPITKYRVTEATQIMSALSLMLTADHLDTFPSKLPGSSEEFSLEYMVALGWGRWEVVHPAHLERLANSKKLDN